MQRRTDISQTFYGKLKWEGNPNVNPNKLIRTSQGRHPTEVAGGTESQTREEDRWIPQSSASSSVNKTGLISSATKVQKEKEISLSAVSSTNPEYNANTHTHTQCQSISARHSVCMSQADRCHTALMQTCIRQASDLSPRPQRSAPLSSPLIASMPVCLMREKTCTHSHKIRMQYSRCM